MILRFEVQQLLLCYSVGEVTNVVLFQIRCTCQKCRNMDWKPLDDVKYDLYQHEKTIGYGISMVKNLNNRKYQIIKQKLVKTHLKCGSL